MTTHTEGTAIISGPLNEITRELRKDVPPALGGKPPSDVTAGDIDQLASVVLERVIMRPRARMR